MKRRVPWFELCLLVGVAVLGFVIWKSVAPEMPVDVASNGTPDPATMSPNYRYTGVVMARVPVEWGGDSQWIAGALDMEMWKFVMKQTGPQSKYTLQLEVREEQKKPLVLMTFDNVSFAFDTTATKKAFLFVVIMPLNGSLARCDRIKCQVGTRDVSSSMTVDNPFKGKVGSGSPIGSSQPDIPLWETRFGNGQTLPRTRTLYLKIIPQAATTR